MKFLFSHKIVPHIAFMLTAILILDLFVFPKRESREVVDNRTFEKKRNPGDYYLITRNGNMYRVPKYLFNTILIDQEIGIYKTVLFGRYVKISWCEVDRTCHIQNTGPFNSFGVEYLLLGGLCLASLLSASGILKIHTINNYVLFFFSAGAFAYYFVY